MRSPTALIPSELTCACQAHHARSAAQRKPGCARQRSWWWVRVVWGRQRLCTWLPLGSGGWGWSTATQWSAATCTVRFAATFPYSVWWPRSKHSGFERFAALQVIHSEAAVGKHKALSAATACRAINSSIQASCLGPALC